MASTQLIRDIFEHDIDRKIEEVIKVDQDDERVVAEEISEYVVTDHIRTSYAKVLEAFDEANRKPTEGVGVWISGFFGSGKSSFAKILGYVLENRRVAGKSATELFLRRANDDRIKAVLAGINQRVPTRSIIFDVRAEGDSVRGDRLKDIMYRQLLVAFGYSKTFTLAQLELDLEGDEELETFKASFAKLHGKAWDDRKNVHAFAKLEASAALHAMRREGCAQPDSWARSVEDKGITPRELAQRAMEILERRGDGRRLVFVIDEVGQFVARSQDRLEDLRAIVEQLGKTGKGRLWLVVTSQEKLNEIVEDIYDDRSQLAKVQDRFPKEFWVDLHPSDIREVTERRVLLKNARGEKALAALYQANEGALRAHTKVRIRGKDATLTQDDLVSVYPLLPYHIELAISIVSGLRLQGESPRHVGGANRTIIKLAQQTIAAGGGNLGARPVGGLVTLDLLYDLLVHSVSNELKIEINKVEERFGSDSVELKVAKAITLLEFQRELTRTKEHLAAVLYPSIGAAPLTAQVDASLKALIDAEFVRQAEDGYKLQRPIEKGWSEERRAIRITPADRKRLIKQFLGEQLEQVRPYQHQGIRTFKPNFFVDGEGLGRADGDIRIELHTADAGEAYAAKCADVTEQSRRDKTTLFWVVPLDDQLHAEVEDFDRTKKMIEKKERQNLTPEERALLGEEKERANRLQQPSNIPRLTRSCALAGTQYFEGVKSDVKDLGEDASTVVRSACQAAVPTLYPKFDLAAVNIQSAHVEKLLKDSNLAGLPPLFHEADGLGLVRREGGGYKINQECPALQEVLNVVRDGGRTGKDLDTHFTGRPYGWDVEAVKLFLACLLRAGVIEARFKNALVKGHQEPQALELFRTMPNFRGASFSLREGVKPRDITAAAKWYKELWGKDIDDMVNEEAVHATIAQALAPEREKFLALGHELRSSSLPGHDDVLDLTDALKAIIDHDPADAIRVVATEGDDLKARIQRAGALRRAMTADALTALGHARAVVRDTWPKLAQVLEEKSPLRDAGERLKDNLASDKFDARLDSIRSDTATILEAYRERFEDLHARRTKAYREAAEALQSNEDFAKLGSEDQGRIRRPLQEGVCAGLKLEGSACVACGGELATLSAQLELLESRRSEALRKVQEQLGGRVTTARIRIRDVVQEPITNPEQAERAVASIKKVVLDELEKSERVVLE